MTKEEYRNYLDQMKSNLTNEDLINIRENLKDLRKDLANWKEKSQREIKSESDNEFVNFAKERCSDIEEQINDIRYILNES